MTGSLPELLARAAAERPEHPAVVADRTLSYGELHDLASRVAAALAHAGIRPGDRVAVSARSRSLASICRIVRAGAAAVPIDRHHRCRVPHIANDCAVAAVIADPERSRRLHRAARGMSRLDVGGSTPCRHPVRFSRPAERNDLAYILYVRLDRRPEA
jgi:acyl-CoA synthetase (AMP-forming)/AMP-acid ligase II